MGTITHRIPRSSLPLSPVRQGGQHGARFLFNAADARDVTGRSTSVISNNPARVRNEGARCLRLDSAADIVCTPRVPVTSGSFSIIFRYKQISTVNHGGTLFILLGTAGNNNQIACYTLNTGVMRADMYNNNGAVGTADTASGSIVNGNSYLLILSYDAASGNAQWYLNGQPSGSAVAVGSRSGEAASFTIGGQSAALPLNGDLSLVAILPGAMNTRLARALYRNPGQLFEDLEEESFYSTASGASALGLNSGTDTPLSVTTRKDVILGQGTCSDTPLALSSISKSVSAGLNSCTDTVLALSASKDLSAGLNTSTDTPLAVTTSKSVALGLVTDTGFALPLSTGTVTLGQVADTSVAQPVTASKSITLGIVTDAQFAQAVSYYKSLGLLQAAGSDSALPVTTSKTAELVFATDTSTALPVTASKSITLGIVVDTTLAQALAPAQSDKIPPDIIFTVPSERRIFTVASERRIFHS